MNGLYSKGDVFQVKSSIQLSNFSIIDSANSELELRILESLHILQKHPPLNRDQSCIPLSLFKLNNN